MSFTKPLEDLEESLLLELRVEILSARSMALQEYLLKVLPYPLDAQLMERMDFFAKDWNELSAEIDRRASNPEPQIDHAGAESPE